MANKTLISPASQMGHCKMPRQLMLSFFLYTTPSRPQMATYDIRYTRYEIAFTTVEDSLQIAHFMQNEPNFRKSQMNVNKALTRDYEKRTLGESGKNEPKTNPNEPNFKKAKMNITSIITVDYENISNWAICENEPKTNPTCRGVASGEAGSKPIYPVVASGEAGLKPIKCQNKPKTNPISDDGRPFSIDRPFTSGLTKRGMLVIVRPALPALSVVEGSIAEWINLFDIVFSDLRQ